VPFQQSKGKKGARREFCSLSNGQKLHIFLEGLLKVKPRPPLGRYNKQITKRGQGKVGGAAGGGKGGRKLETRKEDLQNQNPRI